ncbi:MAG TPA: GNAT family N-acetyltransferase [Bacteroidales bacterium]|jgi:GNAT superfamily N-acetyltransferase|nr:GNAT family N-acetyltransferase [Bacteroidales bacterium]MDI9553037.1 GNAT family N-acetyltransferase [Bacteroidota bacterium]MBP7038611.1 GNAT family N-acetyltransferase [Bacteroidales bacterium]MZP65281.1 GNAT family N-acetyltransferase [Bacteroidales bacterium]NLK55425.1 GNAT family N-acetyltransferase [Bacteroidales bacterium]
MAVISNGIGPEDLIRIEEILRSTSFFYDFEIDTALEIAGETLIKGSEASGYYWLRAADDSGVIAFATYGRNSFSVHSWDLYWIAVHQDARNQKLGSIMLLEIENNVRSNGGKILWVETSGRPLYAPTEAFYQRNGYTLQASLKDFYAPGDPKQIYSKVL